MSELLNLMRNNSIVLCIYRAISTLLLAITSIYIIRYLGSKEYGKISIVIVYLSFFQALAIFGINQIVVRELSKDKSSRSLILGNALILRVLFSVLAILSSWVIAQFLGYSSEIKIYIYLGSLGLLFSYGTLYVAYFQSQYKVIYYVIPDLLLVFVYVLGIVIFIHYKVSVVYFILLQCAQSIPLALLYWYSFNKYGDSKVSFNIDLSLCKFIVMSSMPIFFSELFVLIPFRVDQLILFNNFGDKTLGLYSAIVKLTELLGFIPSIIGVTLFPILASSYAESVERFAKIYNIAYKYHSLFIVPVVFATTLLSGRIIMVLYGNGFIEAAGAFSILIWSEVCVFLGSILSWVLIASNLQKYLLYLTLLGTAISLIIYFILIPKYGIIGASIATVISYSGIGYIPHLLIKKTRKYTIDMLKSIIRPCICSFPMCIFIYYYSKLNLALIIIIANLIYFACLFLTNAFTDEDKEYIKMMFSLRRRV